MLSFSENLFLQNAKVMYKVANRIAPQYLMDLFQMRNVNINDTLSYDGLNGSQWDPVLHYLSFSLNRPVSYNTTSTGSEQAYYGRLVKRFLVCLG